MALSLRLTEGGLSLLKFLAELFVFGTLLLDSFPAYKSRLVLTVIGCNNEVNTSVNAYNITDVRNITFFNIKSDWYVKIIFVIPVCELSCTKLIDCVVKIFRHAFSEIGQFNTTIKRIHRIGCLYPVKIQ